MKDFALNFIFTSRNSRNNQIFKCNYRASTHMKSGRRVCKIRVQPKGEKKFCQINFLPFSLRRKWKISYEINPAAGRKATPTHENHPGWKKGSSTARRGVGSAMAEQTMWQQICM